MILYLFGFVLMLMWKNKMFGIVLKRRSLSLGEGEGGRGFKLDRIS
jgi:hypothetical protein